jgi:N-acyl-D-aspartate/D-glutamate deacylase
MLDLKIIGGKIIDGSGGDSFSADLGIVHGKIVEIGNVATVSRQTIKADGAIITPGFVDIHTHYDGQITWDETFSPSIYHGVTTVVTGNCGVGFAPVRKGEEQRLINLMEGVEDISGSALSEGLRWDWLTFPEYMNALERMRHSLDFDDPLRMYAMGAG